MASERPREWISFHVDSFELLPISVDMSMAAIVSAWRRSFELYGLEPNMVLVSSDDYHDTERVISKLSGRLKLLNVIIGASVPRDTWAVGCSYHRDSFVGSRGA